MVEKDLTGPLLLTDGAGGFLPNVPFGCLSMEIGTNLEPRPLHGLPSGQRPGRREATRLTSRPIPTSRTTTRSYVASRTAAPDDHLFQFSLRSRCTATLAGLRTLIQTGHGPDR